MIRPNRPDHLHPYPPPTPHGLFSLPTARVTFYFKNLVMPFPCSNSEMMRIYLLVLVTSQLFSTRPPQRQTSLYYQSSDDFQWWFSRTSYLPNFSINFSLLSPVPPATPNQQQFLKPALLSLARISLVPLPVHLPGYLLLIFRVQPEVCRCLFSAPSWQTVPGLFQQFTFYIKITRSPSLSLSLCESYRRRLYLLPSECLGPNTVMGTEWTFKYPWHITKQWASRLKKRKDTQHKTTSIWHFHHSAKAPKAILIFMNKLQGSY